MKCLIINNCQVQTAKHALSLLCPSIAFDGFAVHTIPHDRKEESIQACIEQARQSDIVMTVNLSKEFLGLETPLLREATRGTRFVTIHNLYFTGYHPDLTYLGGLWSRLRGPLGDYHSQLVFFAFLAGVSEQECFALFNDRTFAALKYFDQFDASLQEFRRREEAVDVVFAEEMGRLVRERIGFLSVNHPNNFLTWVYANRILDHLESLGVPVERFPIDDGYLFNHLAHAPIWPIYPEIARHHGLPTPGFYGFKPQSMGDTPAPLLSLKELIAGQYKALAEAPREQLLRAHQLYFMREECYAVFGKYLV
ncbi:hypothetical protein EOD42_25535 [Rhodovarius crocodyli]|uniref:Polysaccharide biosynthesis enzyme WcbI domain-containing protein n=1 Tax=Rhodovarius crocodyli TaxID=1979269 RepID=A0A437LVF0_9PROT|nr:WcbI family polysaccharide biosynthesis putative acetyltransferase [Rhodovarius crocodyli]RVT89273.1 hypothetical protein EOD42_25535 [Rhodovarius crocodyli]